jgi:hypothetical protein
LVDDGQSGAREEKQNTASQRMAGNIGQGVPDVRPNADSTNINGVLEEGIGFWTNELLHHE